MNARTLPIASIASIDLGQVGWRVAGLDGVSFGSCERAIAYAKEHGGATGAPVLTDTRPTIRDVAKQVRAAENAALGIDSKYSVGPWDEYFNVPNYTLTDKDERWPAGCRWIACFVVVGGSEGLYLHVEAIDYDGKSRLLMLGKTCSSSRETWMKCYESAARISWLLNT